jgi:penicillin V acylase-like amidase (Ntn superfamily)
MDAVQLVMVSAHGFEATLHLAVEDADADSAITEFANGELVMHEAREFTLMTNDPTYDEQLELLAAQDFSHADSSLAR